MPSARAAEPMDASSPRALAECLSRICNVALDDEGEGRQVSNVRGRILDTGVLTPFLYREGHWPLFVLTYQTARWGIRVREAEREEREKRRQAAAQEEQHG